MLPQIREIIVDKLSLPTAGCAGLSGHVIWDDPRTVEEPITVLRISQRDADGFHTLEASRVTGVSGQLSFFFEIDLYELARPAGDETLDAYLVLKKEGNETVKRLAWPRAFSSWSAYATMYGNLSIKKTHRDVGDL